MASDPAFPFRVPPDALLIAGPTAVGKSEIAFQLAKDLNGEIISVDSMQVYRGMDIGTAKPSKKQQAEIPHHLIDIVDLNEPFNAAVFVELAGKAFAQIKERGALPIFCGGTGLYYKALIDGLGDAPPGNKDLRAEIECASNEQLLGELARVDPVTFQRIDQHNRRRLIRAVEVIRLTSKPYSIQRADWRNASDRISKQTKLLGLTRPPPELHSRIESRVKSMFRQGLVKETESLLARGLSDNPTAMQALGYRQAVDYLNGERSLSETIELVKTRTRQFAKRQMTWFKRQAAVEWISLGPDTAVNAGLVRLYLQNSPKKHLSSP
jgi:tRNA dimethylallyltransferase